MRESFIFYSSFFEAIEDLDDKKRLKMYDLITKFALKNEEPEKLTGICKQLFILIKPQILANNAKMEQYQRDVENGKKGAEYGKLGGRPSKNEEKEKTPGGFSKNNPHKNPINVNANVNVNENANANYNANENENDLKEKKEKEKKENLEKTFLPENVLKKFDPFIGGKEIEQFFQIYEEKCVNLSPLRFERKNREIRELLADFIEEIDCDIGYFKILCAKANELKQICSRPIDLKMLIKNHIGIMNGKYEDDTFDAAAYLAAHPE